MNTILNVNNLKKLYKEDKVETIAINDLSLSVKLGEFVSIMGASGCGKTSLLNCISGLDKYNSGKIIINSKDLSKLNDEDIAKFRRDELGFIFQDFNLLDSLTAYENISIALSIKKTKADEIDNKINSLAEEFKVKEVLNKYPTQMSGGQKQRVASIRAIIKEPSLIVADEPTGALDSKSAKIFLENLKKINKEKDVTILMVTHDIFTASYSDRILFMKDGKINNELKKNNLTNEEFFKMILKNMENYGGENELI